MAETLNSFIDRLDKVTFYIEECRRLGIPVLPPDINASGTNFTATDEGIRFGMSAIKGVGPHPVDLICQARSEAPFTSFQDFCTRAEIGGTLNKRVLENLIKCGAFDSLGQGTRGLLAVLDEAVGQAQQIQKAKNSNQISLFDFVEAPSLNEVTVDIPDLEDFAKDDRLRFEKELLGIYVSGHPLEDYEREIRRIVSCTIAEISENLDNVTVTLCGLLSNIRMQTTKKGDLMAYALLGGMDGDIDLLIFPRTLPEVRHLLEENQPCVVRGRVNIQDDEKKIFVESMAPLELKHIDPQTAPVRVFIKIDQALSYNDDQVVGYLSRETRGDVPIFLFYAETKSMVVLNDEYWVMDDSAVFDRLREEFGSENINVKMQTVTV